MLKTRRTKRTFSPEFKFEAIEQVVKYQRDVREVALITRLKAKWPVRVLCHLFGIHRSIYYAQVKRPVNVQ